LDPLGVLIRRPLRLGVIREEVGVVRETPARVPLGVARLIPEPAPGLGPERAAGLGPDFEAGMAA